MSRLGDDPIGLLDMGSNCMSCLIGQDDGDGIRILGAAHHQSAGVDSGAVTDVAAAEAAVRETVHKAEVMAGISIDRVVVCTAGGNPESRLVTVDVAIKGHAIGDKDLKRVAAAGYGINDDGERVILHALPVDYTVDGLSGIRDPRGLFGDHFSARLNIVSASRGVIRNLVGCIGRCHLSVEDIVLSAYAAGLSSLTEDDRRLGAVCIDLGATTSGLSIFAEGDMVYADIIPLGADHIARDIAYVFQISLADARYLLNRHGGLTTEPGHEEQRLKLNGPLQRGETTPPPADAEGVCSLAELNAVIRARVEEILELLRDSLDQAVNAAPKVAGDTNAGSVVLTGGNSRMSGIALLAETLFDRPVRIGQPDALPGLPQSTRNPVNAAVVGLAHGLDPDRLRLPVRLTNPIQNHGGRFARFRQWLKESF